MSFVIKFMFPSNNNNKTEKKKPHVMHLFICISNFNINSIASITNNSCQCISTGITFIYLFIYALFICSRIDFQLHQNILHQSHNVVYVSFNVSNEIFQVSRPIVAMMNDIHWNLYHKIFPPKHNQLKLVLKDQNVDTMHAWIVSHRNRKDECHVIVSTRVTPFSVCSFECNRRDRLSD